MQTLQPSQSETIAAPTIRLRRSQQRGFEDFGWTDNYMTFSFAGYRDPVWNNFGPLRVMIENHIQPRSGFPTHPHRDAEIVTYVVSGTLTHRDNMGHQAGCSTLARAAAALCIPKKTWLTPWSTIIRCG
jgi:quercetin 2,3-dioxygenase